MAKTELASVTGQHVRYVPGPLAKNRPRCHLLSRRQNTPT
jgi:hypothetical protein